MLENYTIAITTFSKRFDYIKKLIPQIRTYVDNKIIIIINGEKNGDFNEEYRENILKLCTEHKNIFPSFFIETRGLSKMWNTSIIMSDNDNLLILNDDIEICGKNIFDTTISHIKSNDYSGLTKINGSFSHFIVNKELMERVGYFDERLLGFGEEDGDISYRLLKLGININNIGCGNVINIVTNIRHDHIKPGIGKYSNFNREFIYKQKYNPSNNPNDVRGMFDTPMIEMLKNEHQYSYEKFFRINKSKL